MAWNPTPTVAAARDFGKKFGRDIVIIASISADGTVHVDSYGATRGLCENVATPIGDIIFNKLIEPDFVQNAVKK